jgi:hypothetical protein
LNFRFLALNGPRLGHLRPELPDSVEEVGFKVTSLADRRSRPRR